MPPLIKANGTAVFCPKVKAELLADVFDSKHCREPLVLPQSCFPEPKLCSVAFRSREVKNLLLNLDIHGGIDPNAIFPISFKRLPM